MRTTQRVVASIATAGGLVALVGVTVVGLAIGAVLTGCETIVAEQTRDSLVPRGVAALVGAVPGYLVGLWVATIVARRGRLA